MNKKIISLLLVIVFITILSGCSKSAADSAWANSNKLKVVVSFNPLNEFALAIGKDKVEIRQIVDPNVEPHDFDPKYKPLKDLNEAQVFIYNGLGMEPWVDSVMQNVDNSTLISVDTSKGCNLIKNAGVSDNNHASYDPHIWLSLKEAKIQASNIRDAFVRADKKNKDFYDNNYNEFTGKLDELFNEYSNKLSSLANKNFVTGHQAFSYLCRDFGLKESSVENVFAEGEPTPAQLASLVDYCKSNNVRTIFTEKLASPKVSETLAKEVGNANLVKIYTLESKEDNKDYLEAMRSNLEAIFNGLK